MSDHDGSKKNGARFHLGTALIILGIIGGPLAVWGESQLERGQTKEKITQIEQRQAEDRADTRERLKAVDQKADRIDSNVQQILQTIKAMEAVQRAEKQRRDR